MNVLFLECLECFMSVVRYIINWKTTIVVKGKKLSATFRYYRLFFKTLGLCISKNLSGLGLVMQNVKHQKLSIFTSEILLTFSYIRFKRGVGSTWDIMMAMNMPKSRSSCQNCKCPAQLCIITSSLCQHWVTHTPDDLFGYGIYLSSSLSKIML